MNKLFKIFCLAFVPAFAGIKAQTPQIIYSEHYNLSCGEMIEPIIPQNVGGDIPVEAYGTTVTVAGSTRGMADGQGDKAKFQFPQGLTVDQNGIIYVADRNNHRICKITPDREVISIAGGSGIGFVNGNSDSAKFNEPGDVVMDSNGNLYVVEIRNHAIRKITPDGNVSTFAGVGTVGYVNGKGDQAKFNFPISIVIDSADNLYVGDRYNNRIRKITPEGDVSTVAGNSEASGINSQGEMATFHLPTGVAVSSNGEIAVADYGNNLIRIIGTQQYVRTLAGCFCGGDDDETGIMAGFRSPYGVAYGIDGDVFVADYGGHRIRRINSLGDVTTLAGSGESGCKDEIGSKALFNSPTDVAVDGEGYVYVTDYGNHKIRKITTTGYTIHPQLPEGLVFDSSTGMISGKPLFESESKEYCVTAYNTYRCDKAKFTMEIHKVTSVDNLTLNNLFYVSAHSKNNRITISILNHTLEKKKITIADTSGKIIYTNIHQIKDDKVDINQELTSNVYIVKVEGIGSKTFIKE